MELVPGFRITFGDMTAMAGDYFGTLADMQAVAKTPHGLQEIKYVLFVEVRKEMKEEQFPKDVVNAAKRRYFGLPPKNVSHFTNPDLGDELLSQQAKAAKGSANNAGSYRDNHLKAIEAAVAAGAAKGGALNEAMLYEGFASHFLTDAFAAGHTRTPRHAIGDWWNPRVPMFWHNLKLWLAENIAHHMNEHSVAGYPLTVNFLWGQAIDTLERVMREKGIPDLTFGDAISGALHDLDNLEGVDATVGGGYGKV